MSRVTRSSRRRRSRGAHRWRTRPRLEHLPPGYAEPLVYGWSKKSIGRTSTPQPTSSPRRAAGCFEATCAASSRSRASIRKNAPTASGLGVRAIGDRNGAPAGPQGARLLRSRQGCHEDQVAALAERLIVRPALRDDRVHLRHRQRFELLFVVVAQAQVFHSPLLASGFVRQPSGPRLRTPAPRASAGSRSPRPHDLEKALVQSRLVLGLHLERWRPATSSFVSAKGPSVTVNLAVDPDARALGARLEPVGREEYAFLRHLADELPHLFHDLLARGRGGLLARLSASHESHGLASSDRFGRRMGGPNRHPPCLFSSLC